MFEWRTKTDDEIARLILKQHDRLKGIRKPHEELSNAKIKLFLPRRYDMAQTVKEGENWGISVYDDVPAAAVRKFAIGFAGVTVEKNAGDQWWLGFEPPQKELLKSDAIKKYMQDAADQMAFGYAASTFYREYPLFLKDAAVLMGTMTAEEDLAEGNVVFRNRDPRSHYIGLDRYGRIDIDHFELKLTAKVLYEMFDEKLLPADVVEAATGKTLAGTLSSKDPFEEYTVIHAIYKNGSVRAGSLDTTDMEFISFYVIDHTDVNKKKLLEKKGMPTRPINLRLGEPCESGYPITLADEALTAATKGNLFAKNEIRGSHIAVNPPRKASNTLRDAIRKSKLNPGSTTYTNKPEEVLEYLTTKVDFRGAMDQLGRCADAVNDIFFITFLEMLTRRESSVKTLGEIYQMLAEMMRLMGPVVEATEDDSLEPATEIIWRHEEKAGRMPTPPDELLEYMDKSGQAAGGGKKKIKIKNRYNGELARLKRSLPQSKSTIEQLEFVRACNDVFPGSAMIVKERIFLERALVNRGMPMDELKSDEELARIDEQLAQKQQQEEQMQMAERAAKVIPGLTKDAIDPNSPAAAMAGQVE